MKGILDFKFLSFWRSVFFWLMTIVLRMFGIINTDFFAVR